MRKTIRVFLGIFCTLILGIELGEAYYLPHPFLGGKPKTQLKTHKVGNMWLTVSNYGFFGNDEDWKYPSCEFPARSGIEYLFWGGLWLGVIKPGTRQPLDTLVSTGVEGWYGPHYELWPGTDDKDTIIERSIRPNSPFYADSTSPYGKAISEQDFISIFTDTVTDPGIVGAKHRKIGLKVIQQTYQWSYSYSKNFIIIDYKIINIGKDTLRDFFIGLYVDADCGPAGAKNSYSKAQDDICGFRRWRDLSDTLWPDSTKNMRGEWIGGKSKADPNAAIAPSEMINVAWISNVTKRGRTNIWPTPSVTGTRVLRTPNPRLGYSFQWWYSDTDPLKDWGPHDPSDPLDPEGTPNTDQEKYRMMSLSKWKPKFAFDPDQLDPVNAPFNVYEDTRYLLSFGPIFTARRDSMGQDFFAPGDTVPITVGYIGGLDFHKQEDAYGWPYDPYYDFSNLAANASWAYKVYDNPGIDTDGDGYRGTYVTIHKGGRIDTLWLEGDGVPDFRGPPPPFAPNVRAIPSNNKVTLIWDAFPEDTTKPENKDPFSSRYDFEGYKVYTAYSSDKLETAGWSLLGWYDKPDAGKDTTIMYRYGYDIWPPPLITTELKDKYKEKDYKYMFVHEGVPNGFPRYYAVTAVDWGYKPGRVEPLESDQSASLVRVIPGASLDEVQNQKLKVAVIPNPYKINVDYNAMGWENPERRTWSEHSRRLDFINLPEKCTIRIYTLNGDLVATIFHPTGDSYSSPTSERWNLISRDIQAVVSGVYFFSIEENGKVTQTGKFVIIK